MITAWACWGFYLRDLANETSLFGSLAVQEWNEPNLKAQLDALLNGAPQNDYIVGWLDGIARGNSLGRGQIHAANYLAEGEDPHPEETMQARLSNFAKHLFRRDSQVEIALFNELGLERLGRSGNQYGKISPRQREGVPPSHPPSISC